ncbi:MAG: Hsp20/alpha crystallin family protein [Clostridia bacterium]|nr:Hsp20/alpha crystallin family protein [Clostridia bacterium]
MLMSGIFGEDLFNDFWGFPARELANIDALWEGNEPRHRGLLTREFANIDKHLYGKNAQHLMKTDVHETDDVYELEVDLPGFKKDQIDVELTDGYITISAAKDHDASKKDHNGKIIRQERYSGAMQRSFYVGDAVKKEDVKAKFENGVLKLSLPKSELTYLTTNNKIAIES